MFLADLLNITCVSVAHSTLSATTIASYWKHTPYIYKVNFSRKFSELNCFLLLERGSGSKKKTTKADWNDTWYVTQ